MSNNNNFLKRISYLPVITNPVIGKLGANSAEAQSGVTFSQYFVYLWRTAMSLGGLIVIVFFIWGSFEWLTAGESSKVSKGRERIMQAIIGLILLVGSFVIIQFISTLFFNGEFNILDLSV